MMCSILPPFSPLGSSKTMMEPSTRLEPVRAAPVAPVPRLGQPTPVPPPRMKQGAAGSAAMMPPRGGNAAGGVPSMRTPSPTPSPTLGAGLRLPDAWAEVEKYGVINTAGEPPSRRGTPERDADLFRVLLP